MMAAHPVAAYKRMTMYLNGVQKSVIIPVPHPDNTNQPNEEDTCETENEDCVITDVITSGPLSESLQHLPEEPNEYLSDADVEPLDVTPVEILPTDVAAFCDMVDLTQSPEKTERSCGISHLTQNSVPSPEFRDPTGIVIPLTISSSDSASTVNTAHTVVSSEFVYPSTTVYHNVVANSSQVDGAEFGPQPQYSCSPSESLLSTDDLSAAPVVIAPQSGTEVSSVTVISSPRTMTKQEAIAAGWFTDDDRTDHLQSPNINTSAGPAEACYNTSVLFGSLPLMNSISVESLAGNHFMPSAEFVSLENVDTNSSATNFALALGNHTEIIPVLSSGEALAYSCVSSTDKQQHKLEIDVADDDRKTQLLAKDTKPCLKFEFESILDYGDEEAGDNYSTLISEEDEPLTAIVEGMDNDNPTCGTSDTAGKTNKKDTSVTHGRRKRGRPPKSREIRVNKAKRTGGRPRTAAERYCLTDCGVLLQQFRLPAAAAVSIHAFWRYRCCHKLLPPPVSARCWLCHGSKKSDVLIELEAAREFLNGSRRCKELATEWCEFSIDPHLLPDTTATNVSPTETLLTSKPASKIAHLSGDDDGSLLSPDNKKYLFIRSETGTFVVPVDSAVGCIVSQEELAKMLSAQAVWPPSSSSAGEFSKDTLLEACSQLKTHGSPESASHSDKPSSPEKPKSPASVANRNLHAGQKESQTSNDFVYDSVPLPQRKAANRLRSVKNVGLVRRVSKRKRLSNTLKRKARLSIRKSGSSMQRELRGLGIKASSLQHQTRHKHRTSQ